MPGPEPLISAEAVTPGRDEPEASGVEPAEAGGLVRAIVWLKLFVFWPLQALARRSTCWPSIERDCLRTVRWEDESPYPRRMILRALASPSLRSIVYHRLEGEGPQRQRLLSALIRHLVPGSPTVEIVCPDIGGGLFMPHGFTVVLYAERIGRDCTILQGVTLGRIMARPGYPTLGDGVVVGAGASIVGPRMIGDGAIIGAGAVVVSDVPAGATVMGVPAQIVG